MIPITADRKAQLKAYAHQLGQDPTEVLNGLLAGSLAAEAAEFEQAVAALREGLEDMRAGRTQPAEEMFEEFA